MEKNGDRDKGLHIFGGHKHTVALLIQAKDEQDLMRIFRESPGLVDIEIDPAKCDIIFRMEIGGKTVLNIRVKEMK